MNRSTTRSILLLLALAPLSSAQVPLPCQAEWTQTFGGHPFPGNWDATLQAFAVFDDGHGPALYAGGELSSGTVPGFLCKWDGWTWSSFASPIVGTNVRALAVFDDGSGPALYVAGSFTSIAGVAADDIAKWDGTSWSALGSGTTGAYVSALQVFDDGSGPALWVGGSFLNAGGIVAQYLARWSSSGWSAVPTGMNGAVTALGVYDDGGGAALYAGGLFTSAGGSACQHVAKWDGASWSALGSGLSGSGVPPTTVRAFAVFDDGSGPALHAGGVFTQAGGSVAKRVAKWDGTSWSALGTGLDAPVSALCVFDEGSGPALYASGTFTTAGGGGASSIARWNGSGWSSLGSGIGSGGSPVNALAVFDDGHAPRLFAGGHFSSAGGLTVGQVASWGASGWSEPGSGLDGNVTAVVSFDDGSGPALFAGGDFDHFGHADAHRIAKWDGAQWSALPVNPFYPLIDATCMAVFDDGTGPAIYIGSSIGPVSISRWNGSSWASFGANPAYFRALQVVQNSSGGHLYGCAANQVYEWAGGFWLNVGTAADDQVRALGVFDDGSGPALYAGGWFNSIGGVPASHVARWNGASWTALGSGVGGASPTVLALESFDDGTGAALYAAGRFDSAGGASAHGIARWDGATWSALGSGITSSGGQATVSELAVFDSGSGPRLCAGGNFDSAGGIATAGLAQWDGASWSDLGLGAGAYVPQENWIRELCVVDDGSPTGAALIVGGEFNGGPGSDSFLAKWDLPLGCTPLGTPFCSPGAGGVMGCPCSNPPAGAQLGCDNSFATGGAQLVATGLASLSNDLVGFTTSGEMPSATSIVLQGTSSSAGGAVFGQGVRCVAGSLKRLYLKSAVLGSITAPGAGDPSVHQASASLGDPIAAGSHRYYGVYYRDPIVLGGCPATSTFNITQQVDLLWTP